MPKNLNTLLPRAPFPIDLTNCRVADIRGQRSYQTTQDGALSPLVDEHGRLVVRIANELGYDSFQPTIADVAGITVESGSAPQKDNVGLVISQRVMQRAAALGAAANTGCPFVTRMFGYVTGACWVQLILKDESGGVNPPILNDVPEVSILCNGAQNFSFGNHPLVTAQDPDLATYIAMSTTGPTYTPAGAAGLWYNFFGGV